MDYALRLGNAAIPQAGYCVMWTVSTLGAKNGRVL